MAAMTTEASRYLIKLGTQLAQPYIALPQTRAAILTGSASEGESDFYSDLDVILYYETMPSEAQLAEVFQANQGEQYRAFPQYDENGFFEVYYVNGVECQFAHTPIASWERDMATVLEQLEVTSPLQKALGGLEHAIPLYGEALVQTWKDHLANYPDALREAMVNHYLSFFPLWGLQDRFSTRDATLWTQESLVSIAQNLLGIMAGLNRQYYTTFQFKRMQRFIDSMAIKPDNFGARIESLFRAVPSEAALNAESLVADTLALVEQHMPHIDVSRAKARIGWRQPKWTIQE
jgi:hypothetical protein